jgi:hypothetical protein
VSIEDRRTPLVPGPLVGQKPPFVGNLAAALVPGPADMPLAGSARFGGPRWCKMPPRGRGMRYFRPETTTDDSSRRGISGGLFTWRVPHRGRAGTPAKSFCHGRQIHCTRAFSVIGQPVTRRHRRHHAASAPRPPGPVALSPRRQGEGFSDWDTPHPAARFLHLRRHTRPSEPELAIRIPNQDRRRLTTSAEECRPSCLVAVS